MTTNPVKLLERTFVGSQVTDATGKVLGTVLKEGASWVLVERKVETVEFEAMGPGWIRLRAAPLPDPHAIGAADCAGASTK